MKRVYVGNLPWSATEDELRELFGTYGEVNSVAIITDRETGRSRGFAFVEITGDNAGNAIQELDGRDLGGRPLRVSEAHARETRGARY